MSFPRKREPSKRASARAKSHFVAPTRGYTNQKMMDTYCLVNLSARLCDPALGRMLSADSMVPDAMNGQAYNRYS